MNWVFGAGLILLALAAAADFLGGRAHAAGPLYLLGAAGLGLPGRRRRVRADRPAGHAGRRRLARRPASRASRRPALAADPLSGLFLAMAFGAAVPVSVAFASWARRQGPRPRPGLGASYALALGAVAVIVTARDAFTLLFGWEALTLAFYLLAGAERHQPGPAWRGPDHVRVRQGQRGGAAARAAAARDAVALDPAGLVRARARRRGPDHRAGAAAGRVRDQGRAGAVPGLAAARLRRRARARPARSWPGSASTSAFYGMWRTLALLGRAPGWLVGAVLLLGAADRAARHRARRGAEPAVPGHRLLQHREHRADRDRLRRRADRRRGRQPRADGGRAAGRDPADGRAHRGQVAAVHLGRRARGRGRRGRPGAAARAGPAHPVERVRPGRGLGDAGRAAADGGLRVRVVPARVADAAVPGDRPGLPAAAGRGRRRGRADRRLRRRDLRPPGRPVSLERDGPEPVRRGAPRHVRLGRAGRRARALRLLPGHRRGDPAGDPGHRGRAVPGRAELAGHGRAEVAVGAAAGLRRVLDPVAVLAVAGDAA